MKIKFNDTVKTNNGHNKIIGSVVKSDTGNGRISITSFKTGKTFVAKTSRVTKITNKQADLELDRDWTKLG